MAAPVDAVRQKDPYPYYANLVSDRPFHFDEESRFWVASSAEAVTAVLTEPGFLVRPPAEPVPRGILGTAAGDVFGALVRMTDGGLQQRLKGIVVSTLRDVDLSLAGRFAADRARRSLARTGKPDFDDLMFGVPAQVVAALLGLDEGLGDEAARLIGEFVQCIPASATPLQQAAAARAAEQLRDLIGPRLTAGGNGLLGDLVATATRADWPETAPLLANAIGLLSQTYDATAGLVGNTVVALSRLADAGQPRPSDLAAVVREVARHDAPIQNTRRFAAVAAQVGGGRVEAGQAILVVLAAANRDPAVNPDPHTFRLDRSDPRVFTFGAGPHRCPGEALAATMTTAVVAELLAGGYEPAIPLDEVTYRPSPNARIPVL